jgi:hypothetical protein
MIITIVVMFLDSPSTVQQTSGDEDNRRQRKAFAAIMLNSPVEMRILIENKQAQ